LNVANVMFVEIVCGVSEKNGRVSVAFGAGVWVRKSGIAGTGARFCRKSLQTYIFRAMAGSSAWPP
jgi:hypothetical protein